MRALCFVNCALCLRFVLVVVFCARSWLCLVNCGCVLCSWLCFVNCDLWFALVVVFCALWFVNCGLWLRFVLVVVLVICARDCVFDLWIVFCVNALWIVVCVYLLCSWLRFAFCDRDCACVLCLRFVFVGVFCVYCLRFVIVFLLCFVCDLVNAINSGS